MFMRHYNNNNSKACGTRTFFLILSSLFFCTTSNARNFNTHWIYAPQSDSLSHVWFRRAYPCDGKPMQASITVASTGYFKLYVNECNVSTASFHPLRHNGDSTAVAIEFDVTPYLRRDTNVIAIIYSPPTPSASHRQISVNFNGTSHQGDKFCHTSDDSWICRRANSRMTVDGGEAIDGRGHDPSWKAATCTSAALWLNAEKHHGDMSQDLPTSSTSHHAWKTTKVTSLSYLRISQNPILLYLANSFWGFVRITIRGARRGERMRIGNVQYTCRGELDEQAFPQFSLSSLSTVSITGDRLFKPSQVTDIDMVEMGKGWFNGY